MIVESILIGSAIGAAGIYYGYRQWSEVIELRQVNAGLNFLVEAKNQNIAVLQKQIADDKAKRSRNAVAGGLARGRQQQDQKAERRAKTIDAMAATPLRPRDEVVAGAREQRRSGNPDGQGTALL